MNSKGERFKTDIIVFKKKGLMSKASALQNTTANKPEPSAEPVKEEKEAIPLSLEEQLAKVATESNADLPGNGAQKNAKPPEKLEPKPPPKFTGQAVVPPKQMLPDRHISTVRKIPPKPESEEPPKPQPAPEQNLDQHVVSPKTPPEKVPPKLAQTQPPQTPPLGPSVETQTESELGPNESFPPAWEFDLDDGGATPEYLHLPIPIRRPMKFNRNLELLKEFHETPEGKAILTSRKKWVSRNPRGESDFGQ